MMTDERDTLLEGLRRLRDSDMMDGRSLDHLVEVSKCGIPKPFDVIFNLERSDEKSAFNQGVGTRFAEHATRLNVDGEYLPICYHFFRLLALLHQGIDAHVSPPDFLNDSPPLPHVPATAGDSVHLQGLDKLSEYVEETLYHLGHRHNPGGVLDERASNMAFSALSTQWEGDPMFFDWLVPYLTFRFMRVLARVDLFYAMHSRRLPHYLELKVLSYLLQLLGRAQYAAIGRFASICHVLYYEIQDNSGKVFSERESMSDLQGAVRQVVTKSEQSAKDIAESITAAADTDDLHSLTLEIARRFFLAYIRDLSDTGQFHIVLWSVKMFKEVKDAFKSLARLGKTGISILIIGETGTGKEAVAKLFLKTSGEPYVAVNCAGQSWRALSDDLFGTSPDSRPLIDQVSAVLLDELDRAQLDAQGGLLRFLDKPYGEYRKPGELTTVRWDGLTVATATDRIFEAMKSGTFLPDLFWRFDIRARVTPLRDMAKQKEFGTLFQLAIEASRAKLNVVAPIELTQDQFAELGDYEWPGNLREMLEFSDSLVMAISKESSADTKCQDSKIVVPPTVFREVFSRFAYFGKRALYWRGEDRQSLT